MLVRHWHWWNDSNISTLTWTTERFSTYPYSTVMVFVLPSGSRIVSSMSLGVVSEALSLTDPFTLPLVAPGGWVVWRVKVDVILLLLVTSFKLKTEKWSKQLIRRQDSTTMWKKPIWYKNESNEEVLDQNWIIRIIMEDQSFFPKKIQDISPFCGATDIRFGLLVASALGLKICWISHSALLACSITCSWWTPQIHLFGETPADLLAASMADPLTHMLFQAVMWVFLHHIFTTFPISLSSISKMNAKVVQTSEEKTRR